MLRKDFKKPMKNIVIFYPSFERGGAEKVLINLIKFFSSKKKNIYLISNKKYKSIKNLKNLKIISSINFHSDYINNRITTGLISLLTLKKLLQHYLL